MKTDQNRVCQLLQLLGQFLGFSGLEMRLPGIGAVHKSDDLDGQAPGRISASGGNQLVAVDIGRLTVDGGRWNGRNDPAGNRVADVEIAWPGHALNEGLDPETLGFHGLAVYNLLGRRSIVRAENPGHGIGIAAQSRSKSALVEGQQAERGRAFRRVGGDADTGQRHKRIQIVIEAQALLSQDA